MVLICEEFPTLLYHDWSLQFGGRQANQTSIVEPQEASGNARSWEKSGNKSRVFSVFLLDVTAIIDRRLSLAKARGSRFFFLPDFGSHQNRPKPSRIPDSREGFPWQLSLTVESSQFSVRQVHPKTSLRWWRARFRSKRLIHVIVTSLCISNFWKMSWRIR